MTTLSTFRRLLPSERRMLIAALGLVVCVRLALWMLPSRLIVRRVRALGFRSPRSGDRPANRATVTWAVEAASRRVPQATCLTQAVAAQLLLHRHGFPSKLCLGVARSNGEGFFAHAWLEQDGQVLLGGQGVRDLTRLPDLAHAAVPVGVPGKRT
jgi:hypothetical protein